MINNNTNIMEKLGVVSHNLNVDISMIFERVKSQANDEISSLELTELMSQICVSFSTENPDYNTLAARLEISNYNQNTPATFIEAMEILYTNKDSNGCMNPLVSEELIKITRANHKKIEEQIDYQRDYLFDYFGFKTLQKSYLIHSNSCPVERIQHMFMRVSIGLHKSDLNSAFISYQFLSQKFFTHATPTLYHSGTPNPQCLSCFLLGTDDSVDGMYKTISDCARISKWAGGIGVHISNIRSRGSYIRGSNGESSGIIPMMRVYNATARHIDQAGKRKGSIAVYLEPHHPDIMDFLDVRKNSGNEEARTRDLMTALMIPDLFMRKLEVALGCPAEIFEWCLFDPDRCPALEMTYGAAYEALYTKYEQKGYFKEKVDIVKLWKKILASQIETGTPYILYKDRINNHSNQKNIGTIRSSNLCAEIVEYSSEKEYACCSLSSISLGEMVSYPQFDNFTRVTIYTKPGCIYCELAYKLMDKYEIKYEKITEHDYKTVPQIFFGKEHTGGYNDLVRYLRPTINTERLRNVCHTIVRNLNRVIDVNYYPVEETRRSNFRHRPLGIGVQGLADFFFKMRISFESEEAKQANKAIFELIQYYCLEASCEIAEERENIAIKYHSQFKKVGNKYIWENYEFTEEEMELTDYLGAYSTFKGSPLSKGVFQFESMGVKLEDTIFKEKWNNLRERILIHGVRNSLLVALMPTASTSQILGNTECFEPITSNIYTRRTLAGDFVVVNQYLVRDLMERGAWSREIKDWIIAANGSVQNLECLTQEEKELYKTVWEIKQKVLIDLSADRTPFVCQTQSLNLFFEEPKNTTLGSALIYGWRRGLKTGAYYIRSRPKVQAQQFTIEPKAVQSGENIIICESCTA
jgi:ribonucleoside-diphosphate reductase alpha subunit